MGRGPEQASLQRELTDGQRIHDKMPNILIIREMQIRTATRCHLAPVRTAVANKPSECGRGCGEKGPPRTAGGIANGCGHKTAWRSLKNAKQLPCDPVTPLWVFIRRNPKHRFEKMSASLCSLQRESRQPGQGSDRHPPADAGCARRGACAQRKTQGRGKNEMAVKGEAGLGGCGRRGRD